MKNQHLNRFITYISTLTIGLIGLVIIGNLLVDNPITHKYLRGIIGEKLKDTPYEVTFSALDASIYPIGFDLYGVQVSNQEKPKDPSSKKKLFSASNIKIRISLTKLILGESRISLVEINELNSEIIHKPKKPISQKDIVKEVFNWPPDFKMPVETIKLSGSSIRYILKNPDSNSNDLEFHMDGLDLKLDIPSWKDISLDLAVNNLNLHLLGEKYISGGRFNGEFLTDKNRFYSKNIEIRSSTLNASGPVDISLLGLSKSTKVFKIEKSSYLELEKIRINPNLNISYLDFSLLGKFLEIEETFGVYSGNGNLNIDISMNSKFDSHWWLGVDGKFIKGKLLGFGLLDSQVQLELDSTGIEFKKVGLVEKNIRFADAKGRLNFDEQITMEFFLSPKDLPLTKILSIVKVPDFQVIDINYTSGKFQIKGQGKPFRLFVNGTGYSNQLSFPLIELNPKKKSPHINCKTDIFIEITTRNIDFQNPSMITCIESKGDSYDKDVAVLSGLFDFEKESVSLDIEVNNFSLGIIQPAIQKKLEGMANLNIEVSGNYTKEITTVIDSKISDLKFEGLYFSKVSSKIYKKTGDPNLQIISLEAIPDDAQGKVHLEDSKLNISNKFFFDSKILVQNISANYLKKTWQRLGVEFHYYCDLVDVNGYLKGKLWEPNSYIGLINTETGKCFQKESFLADSFIGKVSFNNDQIAISDGIIKNGNLKSEINLSNYWSTGSNRPFFLEISNIKKSSEHSSNSDHLKSLPILGKYLDQAKLQGLLEFTLRLEGKLEALSGILEIDLMKPTLNGNSIPNFSLSSVIENNSIKSIIKKKDKSLFGRFNLDFNKENLPYSLYLRSQKYDFRFLLGHFFSKDPRNYAYLDSVLDISGSLSNFWKSKGTFEVSDILFKYVSDKYNNVQRVDLKNKNPFKILFSDKGLSFGDHKNLTLAGKEIEIVITPDSISLPEKIDFLVESQIKAALLKKIFPKIDLASGVFSTKAHFFGSLDDPKINIDLSSQTKNLDTNTINSAAISIANYQPALTDLNLQMRYQNGYVDITRLDLKKGKYGTITGSGRWFFGEEAQEKSRILLSIKNAEIRGMIFSVFKNLNINLSGDIEISGKEFPYKLSGAIEINRASSIGQFDIRSQLYEAILKRKFIAPVNPVPSIISMDLLVRARKSIFVKNRNINATLSSDIRILGTNESPLILGIVNIDRGSFYYKREFSIERGNIIFEGAVSPPDPKLDIVGVSEISPYKVQVYVNGISSDPKVDFIADPHIRPDGTPLTKFDVLNLLTSGRIRENSNTVGGSGVASSEALNLVVGRFEQPIEKLLELSGQTIIQDVFFDTYVSDESERPVVRLNMPIHLYNNMDVIFRADEKRYLSVSSEYSLNESISLLGTFDKSEQDLEKSDKGGVVGDAGVDVKFHFSFP